MTQKQKQKSEQVWKALFFHPLYKTRLKTHMCIPAHDDTEHAYLWGLCSLTNAPYVVKAPLEGLIRYARENIFIQNAFPTLSAEDREMILSGITPAAWPGKGL